jgi:hypothetical protein
LFTPGVVKIVVKPPEQCRTGCHFNQAVQPEADQRDGPGDDSGDNRHQPFETVVADGEVFEPLAPANQFTSGQNAGGSHGS